MFFPQLEMREMARVKALGAADQLLSLVATLLAEKGSMSRRVTKIQKATRRVKPRRRAPVRVSREVYEANQEHARKKTCVCGCGGEADSASRGRTVEHFNQFRARLRDKERSGGKAAADQFDDDMQAKGLIFPPNFNPDVPFADYDANAEWEEKRRELGLAS